MNDVFYGFKLAVGFLVAQLVLGVIGIGIGVGVLYVLGVTLTNFATGIGG